MNNTLNSQMLQCECPLLGVERTLDEVAGFIAVTRMTQSGHWQDLNPAVQRSPTIRYLSKIQNNSGLSQGLYGRTARHSQLRRQ
jgi:hypothetical protein